MKRLLMLVLLLAATGELAAKPMEAIAFYGQVTDYDGRLKSGSMVTLDFMLYTSSSGDGELLWARRIPVTLGDGGRFYVELSDSSGQSYQATDGREPKSKTLAGAFAYHASSENRNHANGPVWIGYVPVDAKVSTPPERDAIYFQPVAVRALATSSAEIAQVSNLTVKTFNSVAPALVGTMSVSTPLFNVPNLVIRRPDASVPLNPSGSVRLRELSGFQYALPDEQGKWTARLPATADGDCGRVVRRTLANGQTTHETLFYSQGDATAEPEGATTIYLWTFGKLEAK